MEEEKNYNPEYKEELISQTKPYFSDEFWKKYQRKLTIEHLRFLKEILENLNFAIKKQPKEEQEEDEEDEEPEQETLYDPDENQESEEEGFSTA